MRIRSCFTVATLLGALLFAPPARAVVDAERPRVLVASLGPETVVPRLESELHGAGFATRTHVVPPSVGLTPTELVTAMRAHGVTNALLVRGSQIELWTLRADGTLAFEESIPTREPARDATALLPNPSEDEVQERMASIRAVERVRSKVIAPTFKPESAPPPLAPEATRVADGAAPTQDAVTPDAPVAMPGHINTNGELFVRLINAGGGLGDVGRSTSDWGARLGGGARLGDHGWFEGSWDIFAPRERGEIDRFSATSMRFNLAGRYVFTRGVFEPYLLGETGLHYALVTSTTVVPFNERSTGGSEAAADSGSITIPVPDQLLSLHAAAGVGSMLRLNKHLLVDGSIAVDALTARNFRVLFDQNTEKATSMRVFPAVAIVTSLGITVEL